MQDSTTEARLQVTGEASEEKREDSRHRKISRIHAVRACSGGRRRLTNLPVLVVRCTVACAEDAVASAQGHHARSSGSGETQLSREGAGPWYFTRQPRRLKYIMTLGRGEIIPVRENPEKQHRFPQTQKRKKRTESLSDLLERSRCSEFALHPVEGRGKRSQWDVSA